MEVTSLIDHKKTRAGMRIATEWGLSLHVKCDNFSLLFDTGSSGRFVGNATALGVDIKAVELAVLSHGHYDHGGGLRNFLAATRQSFTQRCSGAASPFLLKSTRPDFVQIMRNIPAGVGFDFSGTATAISAATVMMIDQDVPWML